MSEFSESFHLRSDDAGDATGILSRARVPGFVFAAEGGWVTFVYEADEPPSRAHFDRILAEARGRLVHWDYAEDHGCRVTVYDDGKRVARLAVSFESRLSTFERAAFVALGLVTDAGADEIEQWLKYAVPGSIVAETLGLPRHRWLSFEYVRKGPGTGHANDAAFEVTGDGEVHPRDVAPLAPPEIGTVTRWDALAIDALRKWVAAGSIELADGASFAALSDALADLLSQRPSPTAIEDFLVERAEVEEVFASGVDLVHSARQRIPVGSA